MQSLEILQTLRNGFDLSPYKGHIFLVGGWVRDRLLGLPEGGDADVVVAGSAQDAANHLFQSGVSQGPPQIYPRFGTAMVMVEGQAIEFASARAESYNPDSRKPDTKPASLLEDMLRRDFTINALMMDPWTEEIIDLLGRGLDDLKSGLLRTPQDPSLTFRDDPLRMFRAVRFRHRFNLTYAEGLENAIREEAHRVSILSGERIRDEVQKMLLHPSSPEAFQDMLNLGLLREFLPELEDGVGVAQGDFHHADVWGHTLEVLRNVGHQDVRLAWAALLHDVAKPRTKSIEPDGRIRFFGHEGVGAEMTLQILERLRYSKQDGETVSLLVKNHMRLGSIQKMTPPIARRLIRDLGEHLTQLLDLCDADANALKKGVRTLDVASVRDYLEDIRAAEPETQWESPLTGKEIMDLLGLPPGPEVGKVKDHLRDLVIEGHLAPDDKEGATREILDKPHLGRQ